MPSFQFVCINSKGQVERGVMDVTDAAHAIELLQRRGKIPVRAEPAGRGGRLMDLLTSEIGRSRGLRRQEVADTVRELATMLGARQDLDRALEFILEIAPSARARLIMERVRERVRSGGSLAEALSEEPASFTRLHIGLVRAGEAGGALAETMERLASLLERDRALAATVQSALLYPALLLATAVGSIIVLLEYVLPQFVPLFEQNGADLPTATRLLIGFGNVMHKGGPWMLAIAIAAGVAFRQALKQPEIRLVYDRSLLSFPVLGRVLRESLAARFTRTLGTLLRNGVPLDSSLAIVRDAVGNLAAVRAIDEASKSARAGLGFASALGSSHIFPQRTIHLLRLGEETAQLSGMALRAADIHEERARLGVQRIVSMMVPVITIAMGLAVAGIVGSVLMAMLSLNDLAV